MNVKSGMKTVELWVSVIASLLLAVWPEFPKEAFLAIITWAGGRSLHKMFGFVNPETGKASWQTSEFWMSLGFAIVITIFPDMPKESLMAVQGWVIARTGIKVVNERRAVNGG